MSGALLADFAIDTVNSASRSVICGAAQFLQRLSSDDSARVDDEHPLRWAGDHPWLAVAVALAAWYAVIGVVAATR